MTQDTALAWCEARLGGRPLRLCGPARDKYFQAVPHIAGTMGNLLAVAAAVLPPTGVVVDAGANLGLSTLALAPLVPQGRIFAFEPVPLMQHCLALNLSADPLGNAEAVPLALAAEAGPLVMYEGQDFGAGSMVVPPEHLLAQQLPAMAVRATTLDGFMAERGLARLDLLKVDVEGFEAEVLRGAAASLARHNPVVFVELNSFLLVAVRNRSPRDFVEELQARFRHVLWLDPAGHVHRVTPGAALHGFLHDHFVHRQAMDDLCCCNDDAWLARYNPVPG